MEEGIEKSFKYSENTKELWDSIEAGYAQKQNNARILELKKELVGFKQVSPSVADYYYKFRALWREFESYMNLKPCYAKYQVNCLRINTFLSF